MVGRRIVGYKRRGVNQVNIDYVMSFCYKLVTLPILLLKG